MAGSITHIVVGTDGEQAAGEAALWAARLAGRLGATLELRRVVNIPQPPAAGKWPGASSTVVEGYLTSLAEPVEAQAAACRAAVPGLEVRVATVQDHRAHGLLSGNEPGSLVVVGRKNAHSLPEVLLGSVADEVVTHARGPVVVVPAGASAGLDGPVVAGVDGDGSHAALGVAAEIAGRLGVPLRAVTAVELLPAELTPDDPELGNQQRSMAVAHAHEAVATAAQAHGVEAETIVGDGDPAQLLLQHADGATMLAVGSRGRGGFVGLLLGSTSRELARKAHVPVLVVRGQG